MADRKPFPGVSRRAFLHAAGATIAAVASHPAFAADAPKLPRLKKAVKYGMVRIKGTPTDQFRALEKLGFQGVEIDSPSKLNLDDLITARDTTGIVIHG